MKNIQTFNDGVVNFYKVGNIAETGDRPREGLIENVKGVRYEERTVGMGRYWSAMQSNARITQLLRIPRSKINIGDFAVPNDGQQYKIVQIQTIKEVRPYVLDISLERVEKDYDFKTI